MMSSGAKDNHRVSDRLDPKEFNPPKPPPLF